MSEVTSYLRYLRDVTRKVLIRGGIKNVLKGSKAIPTLYFNYTEHHEFNFGRYLKKIRLLLKSDTSRQLYMGFGMVVGSMRASSNTGGTSKIAAPLFYVPIELDTETGANGDNIELDWDSAQLNLELLADFVGKATINEDEDGEGSEARGANPVQQDDLQLLAEADDVLQEKCSDVTWRRRLLSSATECESTLEAFFRNEIWSRVASIRNKIHFVGANKFDYIVGDTNLESRLKELQKSGKVFFYPQTFPFAASAPAEISTYHAIKKLAEECDSHGIKNELLKKLVGGLVSDAKTKLDGSLIKREDIEKAFRQIPLPLSAEQKEAVMHAWDQEVSYIEGPPGTGKSHTITALMLSALTMGKSVLLVSHKRDAVKVVQQMAQKHLGQQRVIYAGDDIDGRKEVRDYISSVAYKVGRYDHFQLFNRVGEDLKKWRKELDIKWQSVDKQDAQIAKHVEMERTFAETHGVFVRNRVRLSDDVLPNFDFSAAQSIRDKSILEDFITRVESLYSEVYVKRGYKLTHVEKVWLQRILITLRDDFHLDASRLKHEHDGKSFLYARKLLELIFLWQSAQNISKSITPNGLKIARDSKVHAAADLHDLQKIHLETLVDEHVLKHAAEVEEYIRPFSKLWTTRKSDKLQQIMAELPYDDLIKTFPLWVGEMRHIGGYLPFHAGLFDLVIVDESSQVNIAEVLPALYRGKRFCVVGDKKQLGLDSAGLFSVNRTFEQMIWNRHCGQESYPDAIDKKMILSKDSILDFITETNGFAIKSTLLNEHFRSMPALASFTSRKFYNDELRLMKETPEYVQRQCFSAIRTGGQRGKFEEGGTLSDHKIVEEEVTKVMQILNELIRERAWIKLDQLKRHGFTEANPPSIGVLCFTRDQRNYLKELIVDEEAFDETERRLHNLFVGTTEEFQGSERNIMILTLAHDGVAPYGKQFYENDRRLNVATSRAINYTYFVYGGLPKNALAFKSYLRHFGHEVESQSDAEETYDESVIRKYDWVFDKARYMISNMESEFEHRVSEYLEDYRDSLPSSDDVRLYNQVRAGTAIDSCGQKRLDFVIYCGRTKKSVAVEVDGQHHYDQGSGRNYGEAHIERVAILKRAGWNIVHIPYYQWYDRGWLCDREDSAKFQQSWNVTKAQIDKALGINRVVKLTQDDE